MADRSDISSYMWPDSEIHGSSTSPASNPIPAHSHSQIDHGFSRSVNAAAAAIAANSQHGPGPGIQSNPLYSPPGTSSSSPAASSHLSRHHDLLPGGSLGSNTLNSPPTSTAAAAAVALAISAASNPPTSPLIVPQPLKMARPPKTYHCRMCDQEYDNKSDMHRHNKEIHLMQEKAHKCMTCIKTFPSSQQLTQHQLVHSNLRKYKCVYCEKMFKQLSHVQQHQRRHTGERPYRCMINECGKAFAQLSNLQSHQRNHRERNVEGDRKPYICQICDRRFTTETSLKNHASKLHDGLAPVPEKSCTICGREFFLNDKYIRHVYKMHPDYWAAFSGGQPLEKFLPPPPPPSLPHQQHQRQSCDLSMREKRFPCSMCDKRFSHETGLVKHMMTHPQGAGLNMQLFSCSVCQKVFTKESFLERHVDMKLDTEHTLLYAVMRRKSSEMHRLQLEAAKQVQKITLPRGFNGVKDRTNGIVEKLHENIKNYRDPTRENNHPNINNCHGSTNNMPLDASMNGLNRDSSHIGNKMSLPNHRDSTDDVIVVNNESTLCLSTPSGEIIPSTPDNIRRQSSTADSSPLDVSMRSPGAHHMSHHNGNPHNSSNMDHSNLPPPYSNSSSINRSTSSPLMNGLSILADLDAAASAAAVANATAAGSYSSNNRIDDNVHDMSTAAFTHRLMQQAVSSALPPSDFDIMKSSYTSTSLMSSLTRPAPGGPPPLHFGPSEGMPRFNGHVDLPPYMDMNLLSPGPPYHHHHHSSSSSHHQQMKAAMTPRPGSLQFPPLHDQLMSSQRIDQYQQSMELAGMLSSLAHGHAAH